MLHEPHVNTPKPQLTVILREGDVLGHWIFLVKSEMNRKTLPISTLRIKNVYKCISLFSQFIKYRRGMQFNLYFITQIFMVPKVILLGISYLGTL